MNGGIEALLTGENFLKGVFKGAVIGGAIAGVSWGINKLVNSKENTFLDADSKFELNGEKFESKEELLEYINNNIGDVETIKKKLNITDIDLANHNNLPKSDTKYTTLKKGLMHVYERDIFGEPTKKLLSIPGATTIKGTGNSSRILVSPALKGLHIDGHSLTTTFLNHEFIHSYHYMKGLRISTLMERSAWSYNYAYARYHNLNIKPFLKQIKELGGFNLKYNSYKWSNAGLDKFIKLF